MDCSIRSGLHAQLIARSRSSGFDSLAVFFTCRMIPMNRAAKVCFGCPNSRSHVIDIHGAILAGTGLEGRWWFQVPPRVLSGNRAGMLMDTGLQRLFGSEKRVNRVLYEGGMNRPIALPGVPAPPLPARRRGNGVSQIRRNKTRSHPASPDQSMAAEGSGVTNACVNSA